MKKILFALVSICIAGDASSQALERVHYLPFGLDVANVFTSIALVDLNADGKSDIVMAQHAAGSTDISIAYHDGMDNGSLADVQTSPDLNIALPIDHPVQIATIDYDGDGDKDILVLVRDLSALESSIKVLINQGSISTPSYTNSLGTTPFTTLFVDGHLSVADMNKDSLEDVITSDIEGATKIYMNQGSGNYVEGSIPIVFHFSSKTSFTEADIDLDGQKEIISFNFSQGLHFYRHTPSGLQPADKIKRTFFDPLQTESQFYELKGGDFFGEGKDGLFLNAFVVSSGRLSTEPWYFTDVSACFPTYTVVAEDADLIGSITAQHLINTSGNIAVQPGPLTLRANVVELLPGFSIPAATIFEIFSEGCEE